MTCGLATKIAGGWRKRRERERGGKKKREHKRPWKKRERWTVSERRNRPNNVCRKEGGKRMDSLKMKTVLTVDINVFTPFLPTLSTRINRTHPNKTETNLFY